VGVLFRITNIGTHEDGKMVLFKTISLDGTKPNTNPKTTPNPNTNPNPKLTLILTPFSCFMLFFEHRLLIFSLAQIYSDDRMHDEINTNNNCWQHIL